MEPASSGEIRLDDLREGCNNFKFEIAPEEIDFEHEFYVVDGTVRADVMIRRSVENFEIKGNLSVDICGDCCRCLGRLKELVEARLDFLLQRRQASQEELISAQDDGGIEIVELGTRAIDLAIYMRETIFLELPMRIPSEKVDSFCPHCGDGSSLDNYKGQDQSDPRWEKLKKVRFVE
ncbi:MAG: DUF177 domain-containing protein [Candidatus Latescibacterota bacterium]|nr:DUF177 domain-containing protein [Candidatus Latescibacterota bacterium]